MAEIWSPSRHIFNKKSFSFLGICYTFGIGVSVQKILSHYKHFTATPHFISPDIFHRGHPHSTYYVMGEEGVCQDRTQ